MSRSGLVPQAQFLAPLLGVWRGEGRGKPMHSEVGYLRASARTASNLVAQPTGFVETHAGRFVGGRLDLAPLSVTPTPTALPVTTVQRHITVTADRWEYLLRMGMNGEPPADHLLAGLQRVPDDA